MSAYWQAKMEAVIRAAAAGDSAPLAVTADLIATAADRLAALEAENADLRELLAVSELSLKEVTQKPAIVPNPQPLSEESSNG